MSMVFRSEEDRLRYHLGAAAQALQDAAEAMDGKGYPMLQQQLAVAAQRARTSAAEGATPSATEVRDGRAHRSGLRLQETETRTLSAVWQKRTEGLARERRHRAHDTGVPVLLLE